MEFLDTQIVSYKFKGNTKFFKGSIEGRYLSSIVVLEFLGIMNQDYGAKMYPNEFRRSQLSPLVPLRICKWPFGKDAGKRSTDRLVIDFNGEFDSIAIYSNEAVSNLINKKDRLTLLLFAYNALSKSEYKKFKKRLDFLLDNNLQIVPVTQSIIERMQQIYDAIKNEYNFKRNYRNSFMDLLIVATAIENHGTLLSKDKELNKVLKKCCSDFDMRRDADGIVHISYRTTTNKKEKSNNSKGYINTPWRIKLENSWIN